MTEKRKTGRSPAMLLFTEYNKDGKYSLQEWHDVFVEMCDPLEYTAAIHLAGSWEAWNQLKRNWPHFRNVILKSWLEEVDIKLRSAAVINLCTQANGEKGSAAAKWLAEGRYRQRGPGKPSKAEVERAARVEAGVEKEVEDDVKRVATLLP